MSLRFEGDHQVEPDFQVQRLIAGYQNFSDVARQQALTLLGQEFDKSTENYASDFELGKQHVVGSFAGDRLAGLGTYTLYDAGRILPQLFYSAEFEADRMVGLRLRGLGQLIADREGAFPGSASLVGELAYAVVDSGYRGVGIGRNLFDERLRLLHMNPQVGGVFTIARGAESQISLQNQLLDYMLSAERAENGISANGKVNVQGNFVPAEDIQRDLHFDISGLTPYSGASATIAMAEKAGFASIGFSRRLYPLWYRDSSSPST